MFLVNDVPKKDIEEVLKNAVDLDQSRLAQYAWFILFLGADKNQILAASKLSQSNRGTLPTPSVQAEEREPSTKMRVKTVPTRKYTQDFPSDPEDNPGFG